MTETKSKPVEAGADSSHEPPWARLLQGAGERLLPVLITAGSMIGFVAFAGSVIVWTRFYALNVPPDQAVAAFPRSELVAIGASLLLLYGFFGALAVLAVYLIDRGGRATPGMSLGLLILLMLEGVGAICFATGNSLSTRVLAAEVLLLGMGFALWCTFVGSFVRYERGQADSYVKEVDSYVTEIEEEPKDRPFRRADGSNAVPWSVVLRTVIAAIAVAAAAAMTARIFGGSTLVAGIVGVAVLGGALALAVVCRWVGFHHEAEAGRSKRDVKQIDPESLRAWTLRLPAWIAIAAAPLAAAVAAVPLNGSAADAGKAAGAAFLLAFLSLAGFGRVRRRWQLEEHCRRSDPQLAVRERKARKRAEDARHRELREWSKQFAGKGRAWRLRWGRRTKPQRLELTAAGMVAFALSMVASIVLPAVILREAWLIGSLLSAVVLTAALWRISTLAQSRFLWYGLAVFISVPLFGTLSWMARNLGDPQVQPVALIRQGDGPEEAIQGLYVTEADERVYFATVAAEGCSREVTPNSGRLLWVPRSEVVAMSVGPLQSVDDAAKSSLEMSYALTPAVETPSGKAVAANADKEAAANGSAGATASRRKRLEDAGVAVRPTFGSGLRLEPEDVSPGDVVTLRMSEPRRNGDVEGFGRERSRRTLRLGGVKVNILKEPAHEAVNAEYVQVRGGPALRIQKRILYTKVGAEYEELRDHPEGRGRFIKVTDQSVAGVDDGDLATGMFVRLGPGGRRLMRVSRDSTDQLARLMRGLLVLASRVIDPSGESISWDEPGQRSSSDGRPRVVMRDGRRLALDYTLSRQAWHEDHIRFEVPEKASTGPVTVECEQLAGQPLLQVQRPPTARIAVQMKEGTGLVRFDSRRSSDRGGRIKSRRWIVDGLPGGTESSMARRLPSRLAPHRIRLVVVDDDDEVDSAEVRLLRLPTSFFPFGAPDPEPGNPVKKIRRTLARISSELSPVAIEVDGHTDDVGEAQRNVKLSLERAESVRDALLTPALAGKLGIAGEGVPVTARGFGETCPVDPSGGRLRANRRVELFVLGDGTAVSSPERCHAGATKRTTW